MTPKQYLNPFRKHSEWNIRINCKLQRPHLRPKAHKNPSIHKSIHPSKNPQCPSLISQWNQSESRFHSSNMRTISERSGISCVPIISWISPTCSSIWFKRSRWNCNRFIVWWVDHEESCAVEGWMVDAAGDCQEETDWSDCLCEAMDRRGIPAKTMI